MKTSRPLLLSRPAVISALVIGFSLVIGTILLSAVSVHGVKVAGARMGHAQTTLLQINRLLSTLLDAETGQRGYVLTGLDKYLEPYADAKTKAGREIALLRSGLTGSPAQTAALDEIKALVDRKFAGIDRTIALRRHNVGASLNIVGTGEGLVTMNALRDRLHVLEQNELAEINARSALAARNARGFQLVGLGLMAVAVALALTVAHLLVRRVRELEDLITVCAWTNRVKYEGQWVSFEQYLHKRFNLRFTHGISEEATRKLLLEEVELEPARRPPAPPASRR